MFGSNIPPQPREWTCECEVTWKGPSSRCWACGEPGRLESFALMAARLVAWRESGCARVNVYPP